jgi:hypothetical protein
MRVMISQSMYFPWHGFLSQISMCDLYIQYDGVRYSKGSFTNRVQVQLPDRSEISWMTIPIKRASLVKNICQTFPDKTKPWPREHSGLLKHAYGGTSNYEMVKDLFVTFSNSLDVEFDVGSIALNSTRIVCDYLGIGKSLGWINGNDLYNELSGTQRVIAILEHFGAKRYLSGLGGKNYLETELFEKSGITLEYMSYGVKQYPQMFGGFKSEVSILDMIAHLGVEAPNYFASTIERG